MSVPKADSNTVGSATAIVADNAPPAKAKPIGQGSAASPGGTLPPARTHAARKSTETTPLKFERIDKALRRLWAAQDKDRAAGAKVESKETTAAGDALSEAIDDEVARGCRVGPFFYSYRSADKRDRETHILAHYAGQRGQADVGQDIQLGHFERVVFEVSEVSEAMKTRPRSSAEAGARVAEFNDILDDAVDLVKGQHPEDGKQLFRLENFLKALRQENKNLDKDVFATVVIDIATAMNISSERDLDTLESIVKNDNNQDIATWIRARRLAL